MVWNPDTAGNEAGKIKFEIVPFVHGRALDIGQDAPKLFPNAIRVGTTTSANVFDNPAKLECFASGVFDSVFSSHMLDRIADPVAALARWWDVLKVGGYLVLYLAHRDHAPMVGMVGAHSEKIHNFATDDVVGIMGGIGDWDLVRCEDRTHADESSFLLVFKKLEAGAGQSRSHAAPRPEKTAGVVRLGGYGDAIWCSSIVSHLKEQGYHVTVYTQDQGEEILRHDPNVDRIVVVSQYLIQNHEIIPYFLGESVKYGWWCDLTESVETNLLPLPTSTRFHWPDKLRHDRMNRNYLEEVHDFAGLPHDFRQKFHPTSEELEWAIAEREKYDGPLVVVAPHGASEPKWWPYTIPFMEKLAEKKIHCVALGQMRSAPAKPPEHYGHIVGTSWPMRKAMTFALVADAVVGTETGILNAVAFEGMLKIVFLSHSSHENLTKHWKNTLAVQPKGLDCYPCHRLHPEAIFCTKEKETGAAACQAVAQPGMIAEAVIEYLRQAKGYTDPTQSEPQDEILEPVVGTA